MKIWHDQDGWHLNGTYYYAGSPHLLTAIVMYLKQVIHRKSTP